MSAPDVKPRISYNRFASLNEKRSEMTLGSVFGVVCSPCSSTIQIAPPTQLHNVSIFVIIQNSYMFRPKILAIFRVDMYNWNYIYNII